MGLGSTKAPESFLRFEDSTEAVIDMGEVQNVSQFMYYTGIFTGDYSVETSIDGENWSYFTTLPQEYSKLLRWLIVDPFENVQVPMTQTVS